MAKSYYNIRKSRQAFKNIISEADTIDEEISFVNDSGSNNLVQCVRNNIVSPEGNYEPSSFESEGDSNFLNGDRVYEPNAAQNDPQTIFDGSSTSEIIDFEIEQVSVPSDENELVSGNADVNWKMCEEL